MRGDKDVDWVGFERGSSVCMCGWVGGGGGGKNSKLHCKNATIIGSDVIVITIITAVATHCGAWIVALTIT